MLITSSIYVVITGKICVGIGIDAGRPLQQSTVNFWISYLISWPLVLSYGVPNK